MNVQQTPPMALKFINREMKERTGKLVLSDCGLREIPKEVFEMDWLEELVITNGYVSEMKRQRQDKSKVVRKTMGMKEVYREPNFLSEIPKEIGALQNLKRIKIGGKNTDENWAISDCRKLGSLTKLEEVDLSHNSISDISFIGRWLAELKYLNLEENKIHDISPFGNLQKLQELNLSYNVAIVDYSILKKLENLKKLNLDRNGISDISFLENLKELTHLGIMLNDISDVEVISKLENVTTLYLSHNEILKVKPLIKLKKIEHLFLIDNPINDCPPEVYQTNDIHQIRAYFEGISRDATSNIEQKIDIQPNLEIPTANISPNLDEKARDVLGGDKNFEELFGEEDKVKPTPEIDDIKLIFVGNSGAGKTQLSKFFENGKLDKKRETTHGIRLNRWLPKGKVSPAFKEIKDKVAANVWDFGGQEYYHGTFRLFLSNHAVYILLWETDTNKNDIISTEVRKDESEDLQHYHYKYWLDNIRHFAPDSPILLVQNKVDKDQRQRISTTWIDEYKIFGDHHISLHEAAKASSSKYKWSFDTFCNDLSECFGKILKRKAEQKRSIAWLKIRDAVVEVSQGKNAKNPFSKHLKIGKSIKIKDFEKACLEIESELTESEVYTMPRWLHNSGLVIYFGEDDILNDTVYLDPIWVTTGIYKILNETVRAKAGVFSKKDINAKKGLDEETVLALMKEMEIVFEKMDEPDTYVAPQYLPETHPVEDLYAIAANGLQQKAYYVRLPLYFFRKVLQRMIFFYGMSPNVDAKYYWKQGILFEKKGTKVMFKGIMPSQESDSVDDQSMDNEHGIFLIGAQPSVAARDIQKEVFHIIAEILEEKDLAKINKNEKPPIVKKGGKITIQRFADSSTSEIHHRPNNWTSRYEKEDAPRWLKKMEVSTNGEDFVNYLKLCHANRKKSVFIPSIPNRLNDGTLAQDKRLRIHDFELLLDDQPQRPLKVFFSYSHKDAEIMNQLAVHLAPLKRLEKIETWSDKAIQAGDEWDEAIINNLRDSDIILFLVSADFIASSYIWEKEIPLAMELKNDSSERVKRVIPIYLRPFDFDGLEFSQLQMIPKQIRGGHLQLRAISQWENIDEAFMEVAKNIKKAIEETK
ncbi:MAG: COR domain-containing protein [Saprospiraceae bacterium]